MVICTTVTIFSEKHVRIDKAHSMGKKNTQKSFTVS